MPQPGQTEQIFHLSFSIYHFSFERGGTPGLQPTDQLDDKWKMENGKW
jgi:hypothetical protein